MRILVIGGTGFISSALVRHLIRAGHSVTIFTRGHRRTVEPGVEIRTGDRRDPRALQRAASGETFDAVYDMIAYTPEESEAAATAFRGRVGRFIHCSTISVYMVSNDVRCPITEDQDRAPLMEYFARNPFGMDYGIQKRECESVLWKMHDQKLFPVTMLRPTFVSGPADPTGRDWFWIQRIAAGGPLLVPGTGEFPFQQVYVEDVARMFARLLDLPGTIGRVYNIADEQAMSLNDYLARLAGMLARTPEIVHVDQETFDALPFSSSPKGDVFPFNTRRPAIFSLDRIEAECGYHSTPFDIWMRETIRWWTTPGRPDSTGWSARNEEMAFAARKGGGRMA